MKLIRVTCKDEITTIQDMIKEIDRKIPGLKWEEGGAWSGRSKESNY